MRKATWCTTAAVLVFVGLTVVRAVTFGVPDGTRHPFVGTIIFETQSGFFSCSGTLMSPTVFMTAGHCTEEAGVTSLHTWAKFTPAITFEGRSNYPSLAAFLDDKKNGWIKGDAIPHP